MVINYYFVVVLTTNKDIPRGGCSDDVSWCCINAQKVEILEN